MSNTDGVDGPELFYWSEDGMASSQVLGDYVRQEDYERLRTTATAARAEPVKWTPGANTFKDWCGQWFGPDSDDDYLAKAVFELPPMAQTFRYAPPAPMKPAEQGRAADVAVSESADYPKVLGWLRPAQLCERTKFTTIEAEALGWMAGGWTVVDLASAVECGEKVSAARQATQPPASPVAVPEGQHKVAEEIPKAVLTAIRTAGLTLIKTQLGYQLRNLGTITAQAGPLCGNCDTPFPPGCKGQFKDDGDICAFQAAAINNGEGRQS